MTKELIVGRTHRIKLHPNYFDRILSGQKNFEIRKNDRDYQVGDRLSMYPHDPAVKFTFPGMETRNIEAEVAKAVLSAAGVNWRRGSDV